MIIDVIRWNVDPEIFHIGSLSVRWYGLFFASSFYFGYLLFTKFIKIEKIPVEVLDRLTIYMAIGTILGARIGHCFFYEPEYYLKNWTEIFKVWHGGLASHGAAVGILLAIGVFAWKEKRSYLWTIDRIVIIVALSGFLIRTGNLMNSEIFGTQTDLPWGFIFVRDKVFNTYPMHPTQIYEGLSYLSIFGLLLWIYFRSKGKPKDGLLFSLFMILVFSARFLIENIKNVQVEKENGMILNIGQKLSIPFIVAGLVLLIYVIIQKPKEVVTEIPTPTPTPTKRKK